MLTHTLGVVLLIFLAQRASALEDPRTTAIKTSLNDFCSGLPSDAGAQGQNCFDINGSYASTTLASQASNPCARTTVAQELVNNFPTASGIEALAKSLATAPINVIPPASLPGLSIACSTPLDFSAVSSSSSGSSSSSSSSSSSGSTSSSGTTTGGNSGKNNGKNGSNNNNNNGGNGGGKKGKKHGKGRRDTSIPTLQTRKAGHGRNSTSHGNGNANHTKTTTGKKHGHSNSTVTALLTDPDVNGTLSNSNDTIDSSNGTISNVTMTMTAHHHRGGRGRKGSNGNNGNKESIVIELDVGNGKNKERIEIEITRG
ncbi:hypothetical protein HKX48_004181 [Thoreauomyces humboldtii]|nr:hypothetical protein HKX48_004181 [Thoreauomyces humboldtii]